MYKKITYILIITILFIAGCGNNKYEDVKKVLNDMIIAWEEFAISMKKADDSKSIASSINNLSEVMVKLKPKMKALEKKYPELKEQKEPIPELKKLADKLKNVWIEGAKALEPKVAKFSKHPDVIKAQEKLSKSL